jgi:hypothetical protein
MLTSNESGPRAMEAMDAVEAIKRPYRDRYVRYSHEMSEDTAEASARTLIRTVPLIYGVLLGGVLGNMLIGISMGFALAVALDMRMGRNSFFLPIFGPALVPLRALADDIAHRLAKALRAVGLPVPAILADSHWGARRA